MLPTKENLKLFNLTVSCIFRGLWAGTSGVDHGYHLDTVFRSLELAYTLFLTFYLREQSREHLLKVTSCLTKVPLFMFSRGTNSEVFPDPGNLWSQQPLKAFPSTIWFTTWAVSILESSRRLREVNWLLEVLRQRSACYQVHLETLALLQYLRSCSRLFCL